MEKFVFPHSQKCIPIPSETAYRKQLVAKTGDFLQRLRWKTYFYLNPDAKTKDKETFGFRTNRSAPLSPELANFEKDLANIISKTKVTQFRSDFQKELKKCVKDIKSEKNLLICADKTTNIYKVSTQTYKKLLTENINKDYQKSSPTKVEEINNEAKRIACELEIGDRIEKYSETPAFITLKDHKPNFEQEPKCRLINPAKTNIGKISKQITQKVNEEIRAKLKLTQWQSTGAALEWFENIENKNEKRFLQMDIVEFYPSISKKLLEKALDWAATVVTKNPITKEHKEIILHARKSLLFSNSENGERMPWTKTNGEFDVTMGAPDGAEMCEVVGLFILKEVKEKFPDLNFGLYRDDGLATHNEMNDRENEKTRQGLKELFNEHGLKITFEAPNLTIVNFLDVTLNLSTGKFSPYRKPNDEIKYVNAKSNHPPNVIRGIPKAVNKRLSAISSTKKEFDEAKEPYQEALNASGYQHHLEFEEQEQRTAKKSRRRRQILWYNPPWNEAVTTNIGKKFLALLDKHFPKANQLQQLLNRNTVKISYSCTKNIKATIQAHNAKTISTSTTSDTATTTNKKCNCQRQKKTNAPSEATVMGRQMWCTEQKFLILKKNT